MGADGGVCWVTLNQPYEENEKEARRLIPWELLTFDKYHWENWEFDQTLDWNTLSSTYGTSQKYDLMDLEEILRYIEDQDDLYRECTLYDILLDAYTKPPQERIEPFYGNLSKLEEVLLSTYLGWYRVISWNGNREGFLCGWDELEKQQKRFNIDPSVLQMKVGEWAEKINQCIDTNSFNHNETWT